MRKYRESNRTKGSTMKGLDIVPHGQFPLNLPVLIMGFGLSTTIPPDIFALIWLLGCGSVAQCGSGGGMGPDCCQMFYLFSTDWIAYLDSFVVQIQTDICLLEL